MNAEQRQAEERMAAFLERAEHRHPKGGRLERVEDDVADAVSIEELAGPPPWAADGRTTPHGWRAVGDTFAEEV